MAKKRKNKAKTPKMATYIVRPLIRVKLMIKDDDVSAVRPELVAMEAQYEH